MDEREKEYIESMTPLTVEEVDFILKETLHGPLPQKTVSRMMATLADWKTLATQLADAHIALALREAILNKDHEHDKNTRRIYPLEQEAIGLRGKVDAVQQKIEAHRKALMGEQACLCECPLCELGKDISDVPPDKK